MTQGLSDEALELLRHFEQLSEENREQIIRLVRGLGQAEQLLRLELQLPATQRLLA